MKLIKNMIYLYFVIKDIIVNIAPNDQGDQIGEFWSGINYKEGKYTVRVVGHVADDMYWVRQWQPKKLGFKGKSWEKKPYTLKKRNKWCRRPSTDTKVTYNKYIV